MEENQQDQSVKSLTVHAQYIKDFSFENPHAPMNLAVEKKPDISVSLDVASHMLEEGVFEVILHINVSATVEGHTLFIVDLQYGGAFAVETPDNIEREMLLMVHCPGILFPYARRIISDVTSDAGLPPLLLSPFDFMSLYMNRKHNTEAGNDNETASDKDDAEKTEK